MGSGLRATSDTLLKTFDTNFRLIATLSRPAVLHKSDAGRIVTVQPWARWRCKRPRVAIYYFKVPAYNVPQARDAWTVHWPRLLDSKKKKKSKDQHIHPAT